VFGGTFAVTTVCFSFEEMFRTISASLKSIIRTDRKPKDAALQMLQISYEARRNGILALQGVTESLEPEPFLHKGITMIVDGSPVNEVSSILERDLEASVSRNHASVKVLRRGAEFAPAMGLIGTLIGLVTMLGNLDDPSTIGPSMAVALLTTFYGALLANLVFLPLAAKLETNSDLEANVSNMYLLGVSSIGRQENPRRLEMLLNSSLPPSDKVRFFDNN
jgi:chemotaxis protein MotA